MIFFLIALIDLTMSQNTLVSEIFFSLENMFVNIIQNPKTVIAAREFFCPKMWTSTKQLFFNINFILNLNFKGFKIFYNNNNFPIILGDQIYIYRVFFFLCIQSGGVLSSFCTFCIAKYGHTFILVLLIHRNKEKGDKFHILKKEDFRGWLKLTHFLLCRNSLFLA